MLEAQCSLRDSGDGISQQGDVIVLALSGHPWGTEDRKQLLVVKWRDDAIELDLIGRQKAGENWPVIAYPYAAYDRKNKVPILVQRSTKSVDVDGLAIKADVLDSTKEKPILEVNEYTLKVEEVEAGIVMRIARAVWSPIKAAWDWLVA